MRGNKVCGVAEWRLRRARVQRDVKYRILKCVAEATVLYCGGLRMWTEGQINKLQNRLPCGLFKDANKQWTVCT